MKAFISYSHADEALVNELKTHLGGLERTQLIASWYDRKITPGTAIDQKILAELSESQLILLVISANFISSSYCMDVEVEQALEQHKVGRSRVVPIIVRPEASWTTFAFGSFLALPTDGRAVTSWANRDEAWVNVVNGVRAVVNELRAAIPTAETLSLKPVRSYIDELEFVDTPYVHPRAK